MVQNQLLLKKFYSIVPRSLKQKGPTFENLESKWKKNFQINFAKKSLRSKNYGKGSKLYEETTFFAINVGNSWKKT